MDEIEGKPKKKLTQKSKSVPVKKKLPPQPKSKSVTVKKKSSPKPKSKSVTVKKESESIKKEIYTSNSIFNREIIEKLLTAYEGIKNRKGRNQLKELIKNDKFVSTLEDATNAFDFFPTPLKCIDALNIDVSAFRSFLEPSCGFGSVLYYVLNKDDIYKNQFYKETGEKLPPIKSTAYEFFPKFKPFLQKHFPKTDIHIGDFLETNNDPAVASKYDLREGKENDYDLIICNPPFSNDRDRLYYYKFLIKCIYLLKNSSSETRMRELYFISPRLTKKEYKVGDTIDPHAIYENMTNAMTFRISRDNTSEFMHKFYDIYSGTFDVFLPDQVTFAGLCDGFTNTKSNVYMYKMMISSDYYHDQREETEKWAKLQGKTTEQYEEDFKKRVEKSREETRRIRKKNQDYDKKEFDERIKKLGIDPKIILTKNQKIHIERMHPNDIRNDRDKFEISKFDPKHHSYNIDINKTLHKMVDLGFADNIDDIDYKLYQAYDNQVRYGYAFDGIHGIANATKTDENGMMEKKPFIHILELAGRTKKNEALKTYLRAARNRIRMIKKGYKPVINKGMKTPVRKKYDNPWSENY
jgi:hypothetical protein